MVVIGIVSVSLGPADETRIAASADVEFSSDTIVSGSDAGVSSAPQPDDVGPTGPTTGPTTLPPRVSSVVAAPTAVSTASNTASTTTPTNPELSAGSTAGPDATAPTSTTILGPALEVVRSETDERTAGVVGPVAIDRGRLLRFDGLVLWEVDSHPVAAAVSASADELWVATESGALLRGDHEVVLMVDEATGLGYTEIVLTDQHVVVASTSGALLAFDRSDPTSSRLMTSPIGPDGRALPVLRMTSTGGEGLRVVAGGRVFLLSASEDGVAVDCGRIEAASC